MKIRQTDLLRGKAEPMSNLKCKTCNFIVQYINI